MQIPKDQILELLRSRGQHDQAQQADAELPQQVDPQEHAGMLERFGLDPQALIGAVAGGGGIGGLLGGLGGGQRGGGEDGEGRDGGEGGIGGALGGLLGR